MKRLRKNHIRKILLSTAFLALFLDFIVLPSQGQDALREHFPGFVWEASPEIDPGILYFTNFQSRNVEVSGIGHFLVGIDQTGAVVLQQAIQGNRAFNFNKLPDGRYYYYQVLQGGIGGGGYAINGIYRILDDDLQVLREITAKGSLTNTAPHDFIVQENGNILLISHDVREMDMTAYGGDSHALVVGAVIQELSPDDEIVFEWYSWDHLPIEETTIALDARPPDDAVAYVHPNGLVLDHDNNIIVSARNMDTLIKIDRITGEIIWRMGGPKAPHNDFSFIDDPLGGFSHQHNPVILPNGNLLLFDNGNLRENPTTRAVEYEIDQENHTARLVWSYTDGRFSGTMGSVQRLPNGNTLINWGSYQGDYPNVTEITRSGDLILSLTLQPGQFAYRAYRYLSEDLSTQSDK